MRKIHGHERDALILQIIQRIENDTQVIGAPERTAVWERGWAEALEKFRANPCEESLIPAFIHGKNPIRKKWNFYQPKGGEELAHCRSMQRDIAHRLSACDHIAEFGCGTGWNLFALAKLLPEKFFHGFDFSQSAVELGWMVTERIKMQAEFCWFDMKSPTYGLSFGENTGVFTFGSVEQLAQNWQPFFEYLIENKPQMVVHVEPVYELYDPTNLLDALAMRFHVKRGYARGWLPWLQNDPRVEVTDIKRTYFGSTMHEGYSIVEWRPK